MINPNDKQWTDRNRQVKRRKLLGLLVSGIAFLLALAVFLVANCHRS